MIKTSILGFILISCLDLLGSPPQTAQSPTSEDGVVSELIICEKAHAEARAGNHGRAIGILSSDIRADQFDKAYVLARRAVLTCGWLRNEQNYVDAERLARSAADAVGRLPTSRGPNSSTAAYWLAVLLGDYLDEGAEALNVIALAKTSGVADDRLIELECSLRGKLVVR